MNNSLPNSPPQSQNLALKARVEELLLHIKYRWSIQARPKQLLPPGDWVTWLIKAGRGFGKTRTGAETVRIWKESNPRIHLVAATAADARDVMVEGESGILAISPPWDKPHYEPSKRRLTWRNGATATLFSADEPDRLRGPQCYKAWADELATWQYEDAWDQLKFGLRLGVSPQVVVTTTPRPSKLIKELIRDKTTFTTSGSTYENRQNLAEAFFTTVISKYEGTRLGRQELEAEILEDVEGALWKMSQLDQLRVQKVPQLKRVVVGVDPAVSQKENSDETGIVIAGLGVDGLYYVLGDRSGIYSPKEWAEMVFGAYTGHFADIIVVETNQGGDLVESNIRTVDRNLPIKRVHARKGKFLRAEPISSLYEQKKVRHLGFLSTLEAQMTSWSPKYDEDSPDRVDALVYAITELKESAGFEAFVL